MQAAMIFSRRRILISSLALAAGACAAVPQKSSSSVTFWTMQLKPTFDEYLTQLMATFQSQHPGSVQWVDVPWGDMESKILTAVAGNTGPDVVNLNPQFASKLAEKGALLDLGALVSAADKAAYFPTLWKANQLGSLTFGLPWYVATDVTFYNRQLFEQAGLDPTNPPKNYAELAQVAGTLKEKTNKYAFMPTMDGSQLLEAMVQMDVTLLTPEGKAGFNTDIGRKAFQYWVDLFQKGVIPREVLTESHRRTLELYQSGELAMLLTGPQLFQQIEENAPDIAKVSDVSPQIAGSSGRKSASVMNIVIPKETANPKLSLQWALFLTNSSNQLAFSKLANTLPSTLESTQDPYFSGATTTIGDKARVISAQQLPDSEVLIPPFEGFDDFKKIVYDELQKAMLQEKTVEEAITAASDGWNQRR